MGLKNVLTQVNYISTSVSYTVPNDGFNYVINVNPSGATRAITLPAGKTGVWINIIDAGGTAGTFPITLVGTVDGVTTKKISSNEGSLEIYFNGTTWETTGSFDNFFTRNESTSRINTSAPDEFVANKLTGGDTGSTFIGNPSNFHVASAEANVNQGVSGWGNSDNFSFDATSNTLPSPFVFSANDEYGSFLAYKAFNGNTSDAWSTNSGYGYVQVDCGSGTEKAFTAIRLTSWSNHAINAFNVQGSNLGTDFTTILTNSTAIPVNTNSAIISITSPASYRYYRINITSSTTGTAVIAEAKFYVLADTSNTFQSRFLTGGASTAFQLDTLLPKNDSATNITDGNILIEYCTDGVGTTWSTQLGLTATKALGVITATSFWLRYEMVGVVKLGSISISTAATYSSIENGELKFFDTGIQRAIKMRYARVGVEESTTARTVAVADIGKSIYCTNAGATTITFPDTLAGTNFNFEVEVVALGAAGVTIAASGTATVAGNTTLTQYERTKVVLTGTNTFICT